VPTIAALSVLGSCYGQLAVALQDVLQRQAVDARFRRAQDQRQLARPVGHHRQPPQALQAFAKTRGGILVGAGKPVAQPQHVDIAIHAGPEFQALDRLQGGRIDYLCDIIATAKAQIDGGNVKGIAIMTKERSPVLPNLPTTGEQGLEVLAYTWSALFLPKGAPADVVKKLNAAAVATIETPSVQERLKSLGASVAKKHQESPKWLGDFVKSEVTKWEAPIKASGVQVE